MTEQERQTIDDELTKAPERYGFYPHWYRNVGDCLDTDWEECDWVDHLVLYERGYPIPTRDISAPCYREIFGNPFRPVAVDPEWRSSTVMQLARGIYDNRNFDDLPILADALQDAGCDNADILNHFRDPNATHVRGCWALDLVLGKE